MNVFLPFAFFFILGFLCGGVAALAWAEREIRKVRNNPTSQYQSPKPLT